MNLFLATLVALAVRENNQDNEDMCQIANGVIAGAIVMTLTKV